MKAKHGGYLINAQSIRTIIVTALWLIFFFFFTYILCNIMMMIIASHLFKIIYMASTILSTLYKLAYLMLTINLRVVILLLSYREETDSESLRLRLWTQVSVIQSPGSYPLRHENCLWTCVSSLWKREISKVHVMSLYSPRYELGLVSHYHTFTGEKYFHLITSLKKSFKSVIILNHDFRVHAF